MTRFSAIRSRDKNRIISCSTIFEYDRRRFSFHTYIVQHMFENRVPVLQCAPVIGGELQWARGRVYEWDTVCTSNTLLLPTVDAKTTKFNFIRIPTRSFSTQFIVAYIRFCNKVF